MKRILLVLFVSLAYFNIYAQGDMGTIQTYKHQCRFTAYEDMLIFSGQAIKDKQLRQDGCTYISYSILDSFVVLMKRSREQYIEWSKTADKNNINSLDDKEMNFWNEFPIEVSAYDFPSGESILERPGYIKCTFSINKGIKFLCLRSEAKYPLHGQSFVNFSSVTQIDKFIAMLDYEKAKKSYEKQKAIDDLFKSDPVEKTSTKQQEHKKEDENLNQIKTMPSFPGGQKAMMEYISKNLIYPEDCKKSGIQGRVIVSFTVNIDGTIQDVEVVRGAHEKLDAEAVRVVKYMPKWNPAKQGEENVTSKFQLPIFFRSTF